MEHRWTLINLDKRERIDPFRLQGSDKLMDLALSQGPTAVLIVLLAACGADHLAAGRWAGDRITGIGNEATPDDLDASAWGSDAPFRVDEYADVTWMVTDVPQCHVVCSGVYVPQQHIVKRLLEGKIVLAGGILTTQRSLSTTDEPLLPHGHRPKPFIASDPHWVVSSCCGRVQPGCARRTRCSLN